MTDIEVCLYVAHNLVRATGLSSVKPCVYMLLDDRDGVLYVGQSITPLTRMAGHAEKKAVARVRTIPCAVGELDKLEGSMIRVFDPPYNKALKSNPIKPPQHTPSPPARPALHVVPERAPLPPLKPPRYVPTIRARDQFAPELSEVMKALTDNLERWLPQALKDSVYWNYEYQADSIRGGVGSRFRVHTLGDKRGWWIDEPSGVCGDVIDLLMEIYDIDFDAALREAQAARDRDVARRAVAQ